MGCIFRYSINFDITIMEELEQKLREAIQETDNYKAKEMADSAVAHFFEVSLDQLDIDTAKMCFKSGGCEDIVALWDKVGK